MGRQMIQLAYFLLRIFYYLGYPFLFGAKKIWSVFQWTGQQVLSLKKVQQQFRNQRQYRRYQQALRRRAKKLIQAPKRSTSHPPQNVFPSIYNLLLNLRLKTDRLKLPKRGRFSNQHQLQHQLLDQFAYDWLSYESFWQFWWLNTQFALFNLKQLSRNKTQQILQKIKQKISLRQLVWGGFGLLMMVSLSFGIYVGYQFLFKDLPSPMQISTYRPPLSTKIYDQHGELLYTVFDEEDRVLVSLDEISPYLVQATLAIEDDDFYHHWGISFQGMMRALNHNLQNDTIHGGSTITQQLVKNVLLSPERTWKRKMREIILALAVDFKYSKEEILTRYLNQVNYGGSVYGVEQASHWYFHKSANDLTLAESAFLAGLPVAPTAYSPFGPTPELAYQRQQEVLHRMVSEGYIDSQQMEQALAQPLDFRLNRYDIQAPHFVMYVRQLLEEKFGQDMVARGGLEVTTTLDLNVQATAEASVNQELDKLGRLRVSNGAALVTDPRNGAILAMVGSRDYFDSANDGQVNVTLRPRQPGSSIKVVTYTAAFEHGYTPGTILNDSPVVYDIVGSKPYAPRNYDGVFHGQVTAREALASSYNIPAVRLIADLGVSTVVEKGRAMGIESWNDASRFGYSLTLGAGEVTMHDMAQVYGTLANMGYQVDLNPLVEVRSAKGEVLYQNPCWLANQPCQARQATTELAAYEIVDILSDNRARTPAFGSNSVLNVPNQQVAVKTGTTNSLRDNWTIGFTSDRVVVSWVGNNDNTPMSAVASGITGASPIWRSIMNELIADGSAQHAFRVPSGLEKVAVCQATGTLPCEQCPQVVEEIYPRGLAPTRHCTAAMFNPTEKNEDQTTAAR